jgi:hypothetical protein
VLGRFRSLKVYIEHDDGSTLLDQPFYQFTMDGTRPVTRQPGQAKAGDITLIDSNHGNIRWWLDGATDMEQPVKTDMFLEIFAEWCQTEKGADQARYKAKEQPPYPARHFDNPIVNAADVAGLNSPHISFNVIYDTQEQPHKTSTGHLNAPEKL